ncbi:LCP family protein [Plantactinospora sp. GCM10030261]|uniref:LCP family protein n=1 Tax=Plantactinospora sp. GCM10030261 TaxID=3273420 RepID=UPI00360C4343
MSVDTRGRPPSVTARAANVYGSPGGHPPTGRAGQPSTAGGGGNPPTGRGGKAGRRKRRRDPFWARALVVFGATLMMLSGIAIVGSKAMISQATGNIDRENLLGGAGKSEAEGGRNLDGPIDLLLLGVDARTGWKEDETRPDTIIILHIPATHDRAYLLSIPRDTEARIPAFGQSRYPGGIDKINAAFQHGAQNGGGYKGGTQLLAQTIKNMSGISFDGAAIINFQGFKSVIDALGTVRMCVDQRVESYHMRMVDGKPTWNADAKKAGKWGPPVVHKPGCKEMAGWEALDYSRQRYGLKNGDYDRQRHQQQLIKAMAKKAMDGGVMTNPVKLNGLIKAAGKAFTLDTGGVPIDDFIFTMRGVTANDLTLLRTNGGKFHGENSRELLSEESRAMFQAVKDDRLDEFILANPGALAGKPA